MKKTFLLLNIILILGFLASCTGTQKQPDTNSDEDLVEALKTKISSQSENSTTETATPFSQLSDGDENLAGKMRWTVEFNLPNHYEHTINYENPIILRGYLSNLGTYISYGIKHFLPIVTDPNYSQQIFYGKGYAYDDSSFYLPSQDSRIISIDSLSGLENWESEISGYVLALGENTVFVHTSEDRIYGLDKDDGEVKWKIILGMLFEEGTSFAIAPVMHKIDNKYVLIVHTFLSSDERYFWLLQVDEKTGEHALIQVDPELKSDTDPFFYSDKLIVAETGTSTFLGVNYADGSIIWRIDRPESDLVDSIVRIANIDVQEKTLYLEAQYYSTEVGYVIYDLSAVDMMTGDLVWGGSIGEVNNSFGVGIDEANCSFREKYIICAPAYENVYYIYDMKSGQLLNSFTPERSSHQIFLSENGFIVNYPEVGISQGVDYITGQILWQDDEEEWNTNDRDYSYYEDVILVTDPEWNDLAIDQRTGNHLWTHDGRKLLETLGDKWLFCLSLVDPVTGEEQGISVTTGFDCSQEVIELSGKMLILSDFDSLSVVDLK